MECLQKKLLLEFVNVNEDIFLKAVTSYQMVFFQPKEMFLQRLLHERNWRKRPAPSIVASELHERWIHCNVYCINVDGIVFRILTLNFRQIECQPKKRKKRIEHQCEFIYYMTEFLRDIEKLFNIFCSDQKQQRKLEEVNKLKMNEDNFAFYEDQIGPRK